jgi:hypothetical protein
LISIMLNHASAKSKRAKTHESLHGNPLAERVMARKSELEGALAGMDETETVERVAIETAIATADSLLTGDIEHPADVVAHDLANWLERNKNIGLTVSSPAKKHAKRHVH